MLLAFTSVDGLDNFDSQAEHGPDSQVVLVLVGDGVDTKSIEEEITKQCQSLPRGDFASKALNHSFIVIARDMVEVCVFHPAYLPSGLCIVFFCSRVQTCIIQLLENCSIILALFFFRGSITCKGPLIILYFSERFQAVNFSNLYAPEHLIINVRDAEKWESFIENAGTIFFLFEFLWCMCSSLFF